MPKRIKNSHLIARGAMHYLQPMERVKSSRVNWVAVWAWAFYAACFVFGLWLLFG